MTEEEFRRRHPEVALQCGKSSEDGKWWADARAPDGHCIRALSGKSTLADALCEIEATWERRKEPKSMPSMHPQRFSRYGVIEDVQAKDADDG